MAGVNEQDFLKEIRFDIEVKDILKAKIVLSYIEKVGIKTQKQTLFELSRAEDDFAIPLLAGVIANNSIVSDSFPQLRKTLFSKVIDSPEVVINLLPDPKEEKIRKVLAEVAGELRLRHAVPALIKILNSEKRPDVLETVICALGVIGDPSSIDAINEYLYAGNRDLIVASIHALGEIASPQAVQRLSDRLGRDVEIDSVIIDILAKIQIPEALERLNEVLSSKSAHLRTAAKQKLGEIGVMSVRILTKNLLKENPDLIIHSLNVLGDIGDPAAIPAVRKLVFNEPKDPNVRFAAFETLGRLPLDKGAYTLAAGLEDPVDNVRSAAARAIDRNYNSVLSAGVRNLTSSGDDEALSIIETIISSQCDKIFSSLIEEDFFLTPAVDFLAKKAHPSIRSHYTEILANAGHIDLVRTIASSTAEEANTRLKIFAVDDSTMILNIYRTVLHNLGFDSEIFQFPAEALDKIKNEKPDVILTDLNMPEITGIDLTRNVRECYSKEDLPVIMVTTQDEAKDNKAAIAGGVNGILQKPFSEGQIAHALKQYAGITGIRSSN